MNSKRAPAIDFNRSEAMPITDSAKRAHSSLYPFTSQPHHPKPKTPTTHRLWRL
ncbi:MAG: hypothetical protein HQL53_12090 [Magnetococcales bacterium]|nr:hypothetical protein [Magnetococcales bacterium]